MAKGNYWAAQRAFSRRRLLRGATVSGVGLAALGLAACGGDDSGTGSAPGSSFAGGSGSAQTTTAQPREGGRLLAVQATSPGFLDAHASTGGQDVTFLRALYDNIVKRGDDMVPKQEWSIAESWEIKQEGKEILFKIRPGVQFHDGTTLDAEAVKWNFDNFLSPDNNSPERANVEAIDTTEVVDATSLRVLLKRPSASVLNMLGDRAGMLLSPVAYQSRGKDRFRRDPVASGPYVFKEWVQDDHIAVVRNENYWRKPLPYLEELRWNFIKEQAVHLANLEAGTAQMTAVPPTDVPRVRANSNLKVLDFTGGAIVNFYINNAFPPFDNKYNRLAFAWAIDREAIVKGLLLGSGKPAVGPISPAHQWA